MNIRQRFNHWMEREFGAGWIATLIIVIPLSIALVFLAGAIWFLMALLGLHWS